MSEIQAAGGTAAALKADCLSADSPAAVIQETIKRFDGGIDIIVNNAGCGDDYLVEDIDIEKYDKLFITNLRFPLFLVKESLPYIREGGRIVNLSSILARTGEARHCWQSARHQCLTPW